MQHETKHEFVVTKSTWVAAESFCSERSDTELAAHTHADLADLPIVGAAICLEQVLQRFRLRALQKYPRKYAKKNMQTSKKNLCFSWSSYCTHSKLAPLSTSWPPGP